MRQGNDNGAAIVTSYASRLALLWCSVMLTHECDKDSQDR